MLLQAPPWTFLLPSNRDTRSLMAGFWGETEGSRYDFSGRCVGFGFSAAWKFRTAVYPGKKPYPRTSERATVNSGWGTELIGFRVEVSPRVQRTQ